jgi:hypothetical protein
MRSGEPVGDAGDYDPRVAVPEQHDVVEDLLVRVAQA